MNSAKSHDIKSMYTNLLHFCTPIMKQQNKKSRNGSLLQLNQKPPHKNLGINLTER